MKQLSKPNLSKKQWKLLSLCLAVLAVVLALPPVAQRAGAFAAANLNRWLPIYCVQTEKPVLSVSFDAAWGAGIPAETSSRLSFSCQQPQSSEKV